MRTLKTSWGNWERRLGLRLPAEEGLPALASILRQPNRSERRSREFEKPTSPIPPAASVIPTQTLGIHLNVKHGSTIIPIHLTAIRACPSIILSIIPCPSIIPILYKPVPIQEVIGISWFLRRDLLSLTGGVVFSHPAGIRAKFDFTPDLFPLLAPHKGSTANDTWLGGQVGFLPHLGHANTSTAIGVKSTG